MLGAAVCWLLFLATALVGQSKEPEKTSAPPVFDATTLGQPTDLATTWLVHAGDDPAYANPDFDDSEWTPFDLTKDLHTIFPHEEPEIIWYRLHVKVSPSQHSLALQFQQEDFLTAVEMYCNGTRLMELGQVSPYRPAGKLPQFLALVPEDQRKSGQITIAIRMYVDHLDWEDAFPGFGSQDLTVGLETSLREHRWIGEIRYGLFSWLDEFVSFCLCITALLLYFGQREHKEYLWLSVLAATNILRGQWFFALVAPIFPTFWLVEALKSVWLVPLVYFAFVRQRLSAAFLVYLGLVSVATLYPHFAFLPAPIAYQATANWLPYLLVSTVVLIPLLLIHLRRGNREAGILLVPLVLGTVQFDVSGTLQFLWQIMPASRSWIDPAMSAVRTFETGFVAIGLALVFDTLSFLTMGLIILLRTNRLSRQSALLEGEIAAARVVQQIILPDQIEAIPGFTIESVYAPAQQVGGDFFQILPTDEGGLLLVVGDVAGKGLPAAMLVSVLVGAIRSVAEYTCSPGDMLSKLNERLMGRTNGGFSTAIAAHFTGDGQVSIANAGHLFPYLNGHEVSLPGALPLGVVSGTSYETINVELAIGSRLTFYSDGIIEAQNAKGELFGFGRGQDLSTQPAAAIAEAARAFGQSDDITVVSIVRTDGPLQNLLEN